MKAAAPSTGNMKDTDTEELYLDCDLHREDTVLPLHTSIVLFLMSYCDCKTFTTFLVVPEDDHRIPQRGLFPSKLDVSIISRKDLPAIAQSCRLPAVIEASGAFCRAGLAVVLRHIIQKTHSADPSRKDVLELLGFKKTCLKACAEVALQKVSPEKIYGLPLLTDWYDRVLQVQGVQKAAAASNISFLHFVKVDSQHREPPASTKIDPEEKVFPESHFLGGPRPTMSKLKNHGVEAVFSPHPCPSQNIDWGSLPAAVSPSEGKMSSDRAVRKQQQLNNLLSVVTNMAKPGDTIVDFCSGGGHVGIVLAYMLPSCQIVLIENKEESLIRARDRSNGLGLTNIWFIQANLDYFTGKFNIGVALHACGVATDMVIEHCIIARAAFVICPCCYGFIQNTVKTTFPRSCRFQNVLSYKEHMVLCRFADQTAVQLPPERRLIGKNCMGLVDLDRAWAAEQYGYKAQVISMEPESCSPKNNFIVGSPI
ncbi:glutathione S-transferase C-terminal domain-containing protein isoform X3 [Bufo bufo]|uniref:glutathione S-transferase C-terminal domain-containing protein isoform X3 n=1 Tax=Bufo bufo TaxID=8384 RepID=UPI001ABE0C3D|nr:glutathione S-transferase C-terminal domain-containing protein isoform X3 [Bufo bufo]